MFKKLASIACVIALAMTSFTSIAFASTNVDASIVKAPAGKNYMENTKGKFSFVTVNFEGLDGKYVTDGALYFYVTKGVFASSENLTKSYTASNIITWGEDEETFEMTVVQAPQSAAIGTLVDASDSAVDAELKKDGYDLVSYVFANTAGMKVTDGTAVTLRLQYADAVVDAEFIPAGVKATVVSDDTNDCTVVENIKKIYDEDNPAKYKYTLKAKTTDIEKAEIGGGAAETTPVITPGAGQSDYDAAAAFEGYAAAEKVGNYTGDVADDKATAFKATVSGTSSTGDVIWKVTDGVDTKYHKMSVGNIFAGGGNAVIGLAVEGLADGTASVAFLK